MNNSSNWLLLLCATMMIGVLLFFTIPSCIGKDLHWGSLHSKSQFK